MPMLPLSHRQPEEIRAMLAGFPSTTVDAVLRLRDHPDADALECAVLKVTEFYLPKAAAKSLTGQPETARLREDLGIDSLTLAEAAFKIDELLGVPIESHALAGLGTLGDLRTFLRQKSGL